MAEEWHRNLRANASIYTLSNVAASDSGSQFRVVVSNALGSITSDPATLTVTGNGAVPTILTPAASFKYTAGTMLNFPARPQIRNRGRYSQCADLGGRFPSRYPRASCPRVCDWSRRELPDIGHR